MLLQDIISGKRVAEIEGDGIDVNSVEFVCLVLEQFQALMDNSLAAPVERMNWDAIFNFVENVPNVDESGMYFFPNHFLIRCAHVLFPPSVLFKTHTSMEIVKGFYKAVPEDEKNLFLRLPWVRQLRRVYNKCNGNNNIAILRKITSSSIFQKSASASKFCKNVSSVILETAASILDGDEAPSSSEDQDPNNMIVRKCLRMNLEKKNPAPSDVYSNNPTSPELVEEADCQENEDDPKQQDVEDKEGDEEEIFDKETVDVLAGMFKSLVDDEDDEIEVVDSTTCGIDGEKPRTFTYQQLVALETAFQLKFSMVVTVSILYKLMFERRTLFEIFCLPKDNENIDAVDA